MRIDQPYGASAPPTQNQQGANPAPPSGDDFNYDRDLQGLMRSNDEFEFDNGGEGRFEDDRVESGLSDEQYDDAHGASEEGLEDALDESLNEEADTERTQAQERQDAPEGRQADPKRQQQEREQFSPRATNRIRQLVERERIAQERAKELERAAALRMTPEEYSVAKIQAVNSGFADVEAFQEARGIVAESEQRLSTFKTQAQQAEQELNEMYNYQPPPAMVQQVRSMRDQQIQAEMSNRQAAIQYHKSASMMRESQRVTLTGIISSAEQVIGKLDPAVRAAVESQSPENARIFLNALTNQIVGSNANAKARYAASLSQKTRRIPPEGTRQGAPPPTYDPNNARSFADNRTPAQRMKAIGSAGLSDLIFDAARQAAREAGRRGRR